MRTDSILDVEGVLVGEAVHTEGLTGCTIVVLPEGTTGGVDVRGGACGLREVQVLRPDQLAPHVDAICLAGGSAFGLAAADGVLTVLERMERGFVVGSFRVPIVPAAILFDLQLGRGDLRPDAAMGQRACEAALGGTAPRLQGNAGAGMGAAVGKLLGIASATKSGQGSACETGTDGLRAGALVVVNAFGDVVDPSSERILAGVRSASGQEMLGTENLLLGAGPGPVAGGMHTTLAVVATNAALDKPACARVAAMAQRALMRTLRPCHTRFDGDVVFCVATGSSASTAAPEAVGVLAARALERAVLRAVLQASAAGGLPAAADLLPAALAQEISDRS
jgi:L-aminopeptidase/D-esterase-like protein